MGKVGNWRQPRHASLFLAYSNSLLERWWFREFGTPRQDNGEAVASTANPGLYRHLLRSRTWYTSALTPLHLVKAARVAAFKPGAARR